MEKRNVIENEPRARLTKEARDFDTSLEAAFKDAQLRVPKDKTKPAKKV